MSEIPEFVTGTTEQTHEFIWKIRNINEVAKDKSLVVEQKFTVELGSCANFKTKWLVGFKMVTDTKFSLFLEPTGLYPKCVKSLARLYFSVKKDNIWTDYRKHFDAKEVTLNAKLISVLQDPIGYNYVTDSEGTLWWKLKLVLIVVEKPLKAVSELVMDDFKRESVCELQRQFLTLLNDSNTYDLKIVCSDGAELKAHKTILSARNAVFEAMLASDMTERNTATVNIDDVSEPVMQILLHFLYTGELLPEWCKPENIVEFTYAAGKYQLTGVLAMLDKFLGTEENSTCNLLLLSLAKKLGLEIAEAKLMERILKLSNSAKTSDDLLDLFYNQN